MASEFLNNQSFEKVLLADPVSGIPVGTSAPMSVAGNGYAPQVTITRPNDSAPYSAGDVIGTITAASGAVIEFQNAGPSGGDIIVTDADLRIDVASVPSGMTSFRLHLYNASPASALGDNAAWDLPSGDRAAYLGYLDLGTPVDVGSTLFAQSGQINKKLRLGASTSLYGYLVSNGAYTPSAQAVKAVRLNAVRV